MSLVVHASNRVEHLAHALGDVVAAPVAGRAPAEPEVVVVQSRGMERWLTLQLARRLGVCANVQFPYPGRLLERAVAAALGEDPDCAERKAPAPSRTTWALAAALRRRLHEDAFDEVRRSLQDDDGRKRVALAAEIAERFDHYAVYRPDMVTAWDRGDDAHWQAILWRDLQPLVDGRHAAARARRGRDALARGHGPLQGFPRRLSLFGLSTLPPLWLDVLQALATRVDVHWFALQPAEGFFAEDRDAHPLLGSFGRVARELQALLLERGVDRADDERFVDPGDDCALASLQGDLLRLRRREDAERPPLRADDHSVVVHACAGETRQIEALHDALLAAFEDDPSLQPSDVVVMAPDVAAIAPAVEAVFGTRGVIPYRVADVSPRVADEGVRAFLQVLDVVAGRATATDVMDLAAAGPVRARYGLTEDDLEALRGVVVGAGVRWGVDEEHRAAFGQRGRAHTWRFGLDRMLLGVAGPPGERALFAGVLALDAVEGERARLVGRFAELVETLFSIRDDVATPRTCASWRAVFARVLDDLLSEDDPWTGAHRAVREAVDAVVADAASVAFDEAIPLAAARAQLERALDDARSARGYLAQGVTFCELKPMRAVPFPVVAVVGMDLDAFPRKTWPAGFDLAARERRRGDRSPRDDDRQLFLDAVLSARRRLILTYTGVDAADGVARPPSVVVDELLDALADTVALDARPGEDRPDAARRAFVERHPLQPFHPSGFDGSAPRRSSFDERRLAAARALQGGQAPRPPFVDGALPDDVDATTAARVVSLEELIRFWKEPLAHFLDRRLGVATRDFDAELVDREAFGVDDGRTELGRMLLARALERGGLPPTRDVALATGRFPAGAIGAIAYEGLVAEIAALLAARAAAAGGVRLPPLHVDVVVPARAGPTRVVGALTELYEGAQTIARFMSGTGVVAVEAWVRHLVLNASTAPPVRRTVVVTPARKAGDDVVVAELAPRDDAAALLADLVDGYVDGLREPLPVFWMATRAYAATIAQSPDGHAAALRDARKAFKGDPRTPGDGAKEAVRRTYGDVDPLGDGAITARFAEVARRVFVPFLRHGHAGTEP